MKLHFSREKLLQGVQIIQSALSPRTTLPILHNFLMETENSRVKIASTDLEMGIKYYLSAEVASSGGTTLPAKKFLDILQSLDDKEKDVELSLDSSNRAHLKCGKSRFYIAGIPKAEYPVLPEFPKEKAFPLPWGALSEMVRKTLFAVSTDETRYVLNGVLWSAVGGTLEMVATDGRRLATVARGNLLKGRDFKVIVPAKALHEVLRLGAALDIGAEDAVQVSVTDNQVSFQVGEATLVSRIIEGTFPNHEQVIPPKKDVGAVTRTQELLAVTRRAALCTAERGGAVKYHFKNGVLQVTAAAQSVEFEDEIEADFKGKEFLISFNSLYLLDLLKNTAAPEIAWGMTTPGSPVLFEPAGDAGFRYVVMPMRLS